MFFFLKDIKQIFVMRRLGLRITGFTTGVIMGRYVLAALEEGITPVFDALYVQSISNMTWDGFFSIVKDEHMNFIRWRNFDLPLKRGEPI